MQLDNWAARWAIPPGAMTELKTIFSVALTDATKSDATNEADLQNRIRIEASKKHMRLFRNNVGATYTEKGDFLRYGLANDSAALNKKVKSSDLIGIRPVLITTRHVGHTVGQFMAREVKKPGWKFGGTKREVAQLAFIQLILSLGGDAAFVNAEGTL